MTDTPLNPDALRKKIEVFCESMAETGQMDRMEAIDLLHEAQNHLAVAQPELQANSKTKQNFEFVNNLEILRAHQRSFRNGRCSCEEYGPKRTFEEHDEHVAEVLERYVREAKAEAWDEGAEAEASAACMNPPCGVCDGCFTPVENPYKETE